MTVAEQAEELAGVCATRHHHDLGNAGLHERLDGEGHHRPVVDRQQMLVGDAREGVQTRAATAREDDSLHVPVPTTLSATVTIQASTSSRVR